MRINWNAEITLSEDNVIKWKIKSEGKFLGEFQFLQDKFGRKWFDNSWLDDKYQNRGIGSEIIQSAVEKYDAVYFCTDDRITLNRHFPGRYMGCYLTDEGGEQFLSSLLRKGIIKREWATTIVGAL